VTDDAIGESGRCHQGLLAHLAAAAGGAADQHGVGDGIAQIVDYRGAVEYVFGTVGKRARGAALGIQRRDQAQLFQPHGLHGAARRADVARFGRVAQDDDDVVEIRLHHYFLFGRALLAA